MTKKSELKKAKKSLTGFREQMNKQLNSMARATPNFNKQAHEVTQLSGKKN